MKKKLKGSPLNIAEMNMAVYGQYDPDAPNLSAEKLQELYKSAQPVFSTPLIGRLIVSGTGDDATEQWSFKSLWEDDRTLK